MNVPCILVRDDTSPEDVGGMWASQGILTARGVSILKPFSIETRIAAVFDALSIQFDVNAKQGMTSHAAVVARGWGKPCICGSAELMFDEVVSR